MGNGSSRVQSDIEDKNIPGTIPIGNLSSENYDIENLVFASGGSLSFSYAGAVRVLEKTGILKGIKRFAGVGTGAIIAALLAVGFDSNEIRRILERIIENLIEDDWSGFKNATKNLSEKYGWNFGDSFQETFDSILESKADKLNLTFLQLYVKTSKELCITAANVDKLVIEYLHPKTTPDLPIARAVFMSLTVPGIFAPMKDGPGIENYYLVNGSLLCNYPVHCFDGWLLSMDSEDSILNKLEHPDHYQIPEKVFNFRNDRTLGFYPIERYREEQRDRFKASGAQSKIPNTYIGCDYKTTQQAQNFSREKFAFLRKVSTKLMTLVESAEGSDQTISEIELAEKIFTGYPLTREERMFLFPELGRTPEECAYFLTFLAIKDSQLTKTAFKEFIERKILAALDQYSSYSKSNRYNLHIYFGTVFEARRHLSKELSKEDLQRTVRITGSYITSRNINFEVDDQDFLYMQGWNATVTYLQERNKTAATNDN